MDKTTEQSFFYLKNYLDYLEGYRLEVAYFALNELEKKGSILLFFSKEESLKLIKKNNYDRQKELDLAKMLYQTYLYSTRKIEFEEMLKQRKDNRKPLQLSLIDN